MLLALGACASYVPQPLDTRPHPPLDARQVELNPALLPLPELRAHRFDPGDGLDMTETAMLAVANNPDLRIARDDLGIARAQAFSAGLLPDPQIALSTDHPTGNVAGSNINAFGLGISYDINALLRHSAEKASARAAQTRSEQELLWKEWQVVAQARLLFVRNVFGARNLVVLEQERALFADRQARLQRSFDAGNVSADAVGLDFAELKNVEQKIDDAQRKLAQSRHDLNALLGLAPDALPKLVGDAEIPQIDAARIRDLLPQLPLRRPDLRALQAGYSSQEQKYRAAVLAQFPALNLGFNRARDTSGIYTTGFNLSLSLPIFNGNRGNIAIEKATRQRLYDEYQARLTAAQSEIEAILEDRGLAEHQLATIRASVAELSRLAEHSQAAYSAANIDVLVYATQRDALLAKRIEQLALEQALLEQQIGLQTLIGGELPTTTEPTK